MTTIYKTPTCPRCQTLMAWLELHEEDYEAELIKPDDAAQRTKFRVNDIHALEAPILEKNGTFFPCNMIFNGEELNTDFLRKLFQIRGKHGR